MMQKIILNILPVFLGFFSLIFFTSCSKFTYIFEQGKGQLALFNRAVPNSEFLKNPQNLPEDKRKVELVEKYKKYFYNYFQLPATGIYSKTTKLNQSAVTYLVIASKYKEIKALKECFPIIGCFPYLGFFNINSAKTHAKELEKESYATFIRPVYAYSTLGNFEDTILSSFFYYDDYELAELIFHELFHTIFFIKDEVDLNENLANFFGKKMAEDYFKKSSDWINEKKELEEKQRSLTELIVQLTKELEGKYKKSPNEKIDSYKTILDKFLENRFYPEIKKLCLLKKISEKNCYPVKGKWNNARFAAYLTYEKNSNKILTLFEQRNLTLKEFFHYIQSQYKKFDDQSDIEFFEDYLLKEI